MFIGSIPDSASNRRVRVELHAHADFLRTLTGENVRGRGLSDFGDTVDDLFSSLVEGLDLDDLSTITHGSMRQLHGQLIAGQYHSDEVDFVPVAQNKMSVTGLLSNSRL